MVNFGTIIEVDENRAIVQASAGNLYVITERNRGRANSHGLVRGGGGGQTPPVGTPIAFETSSSPKKVAGHPVVNCWVPASELQS